MLFLGWKWMHFDQYVTDQVTSHYLKQWWWVYWSIYTSLGRNELIASVCNKIVLISIPRPTRFQIESAHIHKVEGYSGFCRKYVASRSLNSWVGLISVVITRENSGRSRPDRRSTTLTSAYSYMCMCKLVPYILTLESIQPRVWIYHDDMVRVTNCWVLAPQWIHLIHLLWLLLET